MLDVGLSKGDPTTLSTRFAGELRRAPEAGDFAPHSRDMPQGWQSLNLCRGRVGGEMVRVRSLAQRIEAGR